jgi:hypothetical protein
VGGQNALPGARKETSAHRNRPGSTLKFTKRRVECVITILNLRLCECGADMVSYDYVSDAILDRALKQLRVINQAHIRISLRQILRDYHLEDAYTYRGVPRVQPLPTPAARSTLRPKHRECTLEYCLANELSLVARDCNINERWSAPGRMLRSEQASARRRVHARCKCRCSLRKQFAAVPGTDVFLQLEHTCRHYQACMNNRENRAFRSPPPTGLCTRVHVGVQQCAAPRPTIYPGAVSGLIALGTCAADCSDDDAYNFFCRSWRPSRGPAGIRTNSHCDAKHAGADGRCAGI